MSLGIFEYQEELYGYFVRYCYCMYMDVPLQGFLNLLIFLTFVVLDLEEDGRV